MKLLSALTAATAKDLDGGTFGDDRAGGQRGEEFGEG